MFRDSIYVLRTFGGIEKSERSRGLSNFVAGRGYPEMDREIRCGASLNLGLRR
jgi:hypothetical protein